MFILAHQDPLLMLLGIALGLALGVTLIVTARGKNR